MRKEFPVWKIVQLGTGLKTAEDFYHAFKNRHCFISDWAYDILGRPAFTVADQPTTIKLVIPSALELGFERFVSQYQIYERAKEFGLEICPPEVGPQLRLQYVNQPRDEWLQIAMEPIVSLGNDLSILRVVCDAGFRRLYAYYGFPEFVWSTDSRWVFAQC